MHCSISVTHKPSADDGHAPEGDELENVFRSIRRKLRRLIILVAILLICNTILFVKVAILPLGALGMVAVGSPFSAARGWSLAPKRIQIIGVIQGAAFREPVASIGGDQRR